MTCNLPKISEKLLLDAELVYNFLEEKQSVLVDSESVAVVVIFTTNPSYFVKVLLILAPEMQRLARLNSFSFSSFLVKLIRFCFRNVF